MAELTQLGEMLTTTLRKLVDKKKFFSTSISPKLLIILLISILSFIWWVQQNNISSLEQQINKLEADIDKQYINANQFTEKDKLAFRKDTLSLKKDKVNLQNAVWISLIQAVGAAFFFVTAYLTYRNTKATEDKQIAERFSKAVEQLGSELVAVRLGGIYGLERITKNSSSDHWTVMEILTAFIRQRSQELYRLKLEEEHIDSEILDNVPIDIQAAITVIGRRDSEKDPKGSSLDLRSAFLPKSMLAEAALSKVDFTKADLRKADLRKANLSEANLSNAFLREAKLGFAILTQAILIETDLREAGLGESKMQNAIIIGAYMERASLTGADVKGVTTFPTCNGLTPQQLQSAKNHEEDS